MYPRLQQGFLMPTALFIVIGLGALALTISRFSSASFSAAVQEGVNVQTLYAAETGAQWGMNQLIFNVDDRATADANCTSVNGSTLNLSVSGLNNCSVAVSCTHTADSGDTTSFYTLQSAAECGGGQLIGQRTIEVKAVMQWKLA